MVSQTESSAHGDTWLCTILDSSPTPLCVRLHLLTCQMGVCFTGSSVAARRNWVQMRTQSLSSMVTLGKSLCPLSLLPL